ncbi:NADP-specific glutamate dehydrogenase [Pseudoalteromonas luteoviolacea]|uniref:NADP-specific glutamate dehydrogenase n=1 Tax=Pseudoalteromonas luteoviolacea TaxID=43657 RepID=UPI00114DD7D9|nr:NADP-specific glutamate dehydrogenase [Pseudoalteromonas luteoviolacea]TQF67843.1 NADP-specific glutamate dehydrogenase [Pseudoalteromonas luteoviolacea]
MYDDLTLEHFMDGLVKRNPYEPEFHQAVKEVAESVIPFINKNPKYKQAHILERMTEPDKVVSFRVSWEDDEGNIRINRGYRVQFNNSIGPYKGGLRFDPSVNMSVLKFLGFEQTFKNSLTTLPIGAGKGGSDFNPKGKSDREIMRFCQSFMTQLYQHIGPNMDVPAGDIGVGAREISYLFGQYKRLTHQFESVLTGKSLEFGGSLIRTEATGYGNAYFMQSMLIHSGQSIEGKTCLVSGSGNVALYCAEKIIQLGGKVLTLSDSSGTLLVPNGIEQTQLDIIKDIKTNKRQRLGVLTELFECEFYEGKKPWSIKADLAFPCATQNELDEDDASLLAEHGCLAVSEGANMPCTPEAVHTFHERGILYAPGKAANAGGVAVSALEMSQNSIRMSWSENELEQKLHNIMQQIHDQCVKYGEHDGKVNYVDGANIAGFIKVADAMLAYGVV